MKTRFALILISGFLLASRPAHAAGDAAPPGRDSVSTPVPDAASRSVELINRERAAAGLPALGLDDEVTGIAARWSRHMAADGRLSHNGDYLSQQSMQALDATILGENVAYADTVERIHELLMQSPPHRRNILHRDYRLVGIAAVVTDDGQMYLTQDFLTRRSTAPGHSAPDQPAPQARDRRSEPPRPRPAPGRRRATWPERRPATAPARPAATPARAAATPVRPAGAPARTAAAPARPAASVPPTRPAPSADPPPTSAPANGPAAPPAGPPPDMTMVPTTTAVLPEPAPPVASAPTGDVRLAQPAPASDVEEAQAPAEDSSPWSRATLLRAAPLLGLALRPRARPGH